MGLLAGYSYRKKLTITGTADGAQTNYQLKLSINRSTGSDSGLTVYLDTKCQTDFDDLRFTKSDGTTLLDYWIESVSGSVATVWIEFDSIPASPTTVDFYLYYGNALATAVSNGANTFIVFDDFERGSNGDAVGGNWTGVTAVTISTDHAYGGTRSAKFSGGGSQSFASIAIDHSNSIAYRFRIYKEDAAGSFAFFQGNGTKIHNWYVNSTEDVYYNDGTAKDTTKNITADAWQLLEAKNSNWAAYTYDIVVNDVLAKDDAAMAASAGQDGVLLIWLQESTAGRDAYVDNLLARNWTATEPTITAWGAESEHTAISTTTNLTVAPTILKGWGRAIATTTNLALSTTVTRIKGYVKSTATNLALSTTVLRHVAWGKVTSVGLTLLTTITGSGGVAYTITINTALALSTTVTKGWGRIISTTTNLTVAPTILKGWGRTIAIATGLTTAVSVARKFTKTFTTTTGLTTAVSVAQHRGWTIATTTSLALSTSLVWIRRRITGTIISGIATSILDHMKWRKGTRSTP
jgi:hypothetical protein